MKNFNRGIVEVERIINDLTEDEVDDMYMARPANGDMWGKWEYNNGYICIGKRCYSIVNITPSSFTDAVWELYDAYDITPVDLYNFVAAVLFCKPSLIAQANRKKISNYAKENYPVKSEKVGVN